VDALTIDARSLVLVVSTVVHDDVSPLPDSDGSPTTVLYPAAAFFEAFGKESGVPEVSAKLGKMTCVKKVVANDRSYAYDNLRISIVVTNAREGLMEFDVSCRFDCVELVIARGEELIDPGTGQIDVTCMLKESTSNQE